MRVSRAAAAVASGLIHPEGLAPEGINRVVRVVSYIKASKPGEVDPETMEVRFGILKGYTINKKGTVPMVTIVFDGNHTVQFYMDRTHVEVAIVELQGH